MASFHAFVLFLLLLAIADSSLVDLSSYINALELDPSYLLYWTADVTSSRPKISFAVHVQTRGYVGLGISEWWAPVSKFRQNFLNASVSWMRCIWNVQ